MNACEVIQLRRDSADYPGGLELCLGEDAPEELNVLGNAGILAADLYAFFCSVSCPGRLVSAACDLAQRLRARNQPVAGGFHSPVEREVLSSFLCSEMRVCMVLARGLPARVPAGMRRPLDEGRLLLISPFGHGVQRATAENAMRRNRIAAALSGTVFVAFASPGGKTEAFCRELREWGKTCVTFEDAATRNLRAMGFGAVEA